MRPIKYLNQMKYNPNHHHRRSIRLPEYDYSRSGIYFVTICTHQKLPWFGEIIEDKIYHNQIGKIAVQEWLLSSEIRKEIELDEWVLMPNHLHGIVVINQENDGLNLDNSTDINAKDLGADTNAMNLVTNTNAKDLVTNTNAKDLGTNTNALDLGANTNALDLGTNTNALDLGANANALDLGANANALDLGASLAPLRGRKPRSLSSFVAGFKSAVTKKVRQICQESDLCLWQRNYYESVIRDQQQLENVRQYIIKNPLGWNEDPENQNLRSVDFPF